MRNLIAVLGALLIGWGAFSSSAQAQTMCGERRAVVANLEQSAQNSNQISHPDKRFGQAPAGRRGSSRRPEEGPSREPPDDAKAGHASSVAPEVFQRPRVMRSHSAPMLLKARSIRLDRGAGAGVVAPSPACPLNGKVESWCEI